MMEIILTYIPIKCGIVDPNVETPLLSWIGHGPPSLPPYDVEVLMCGIVSSLGTVHMDGRGFLHVLLVPFPQGS